MTLFRGTFKARNVSSIKSLKVETEPVLKLVVAEHKRQRMADLRDLPPCFQDATTADPKLTNPTKEIVICGAIQKEKVPTVCGRTEWDPRSDSTPKNGKIGKCSVTPHFIHTPKIREESSQELDSARVTTTSIVKQQNH